MSELGRQLAEARAAKGWSLSEVEAATRIRQKYLEALESGDYAALPADATARGFLRTYARHLGVDATDLLRRYRAESGDTSEEVPIAEPGQSRLPDYRPVEVELINVDSPPRWWRWLLAFILVAALGVGAGWVVTYHPEWNPLTFIRRPAAAPPTATMTPTRWVVTATTPPTATPVLPTPTSDLLLLPTPTLPPTLTPTPRPTATPEATTRISLTVRITQASWVRVVVDGATVAEETLATGQTRTWEAQRSLFIRAGYASGVDLIVNGQELGAMGKAGEVADRAWALDQGKVVEANPGTLTPGALTPTPTGTPTPAG